MNAKRAALLWEELRVGGAIAGMCLLAGLVAQLALFLSVVGRAGGAWHQVDSIVLAVTLGVPLIAGLLLTLNTANSGHLAGGFSRRILRLPVDTWSTVAIVLTTRLLLVLAVASVTTLVCWLMFSHGPRPAVVFVLTAAYLLIQAIDWSRAVTARLIPPLILAAAVLLFAYTGWVSGWSRALSAETGVTALSVFLAFALWTAGAYALSFIVVSRTRCGEQFAQFGGLSSDISLPVHWKENKRPFTSALAAQIWYERKRAGIFFPALVLLFWLLANAVRGLMLYSLADSKLHLNEWLRRCFETVWTLEILPFVALAFASFAWSLRMGKLRGSKGSPYAFVLRLPLYKEQIVKARLAVAGLNLGICLAIVTAISTASFLLTDNGLVVQLIREALGRGETNMREVLAILAGPPLLAGLVSWGIMGSARREKSRLGSYDLIAIMIFVSLVAFSCIIYHLAGADSKPRHGFLYVAGLAAVLLLIVPYARDLAAAQRRGLIATRSVGVCVFLWASFAVLIFPFSVLGQGFQVPILLLVSLAAGAFASSPYMNFRLALSRAEGEPPLKENEAQLNRGLRPRILSRVLILAICVVTVGFLVWLRWPAENAWKQTWRAKGLPTTLEELNNWYPPVPAEENLANLYLDAGKRLVRLENNWQVLQNTTRSGDKDRPAQLDETLIFGYAEVSRTAQIPQNVWRQTLAYWNTAPRDICPSLHAAARSGLTASRYPIDLRKGHAMELPHLARIRSLGQCLTLESLVACVERRDADSVNAILDLFPLGDSLKDEPVLISQLVRIGIYGMAVSSLETTMNRMSLADADLAAIQGTLSHILPPAKETRILDRALLGNEMMSIVCSVDYVYSFRSIFKADEIRSYWLPFADIASFGTFDRLITMVCYARAMESAQSVAQGHGWEKSPGFIDRIFSPHIVFRAGLTAIMLPAMGRAYETEWRARTYLDLAQTAVAVERFRLGHARLPRQLGELVPTYIEAIPLDLWSNGKPLSYRMRDTGEFVVYSYGRDRYDDLGDEGSEKDASKDFTFAVAPPEIRSRPQVAPE